MEIMICAAGAITAAVYNASPDNSLLDQVQQNFQSVDFEPRRWLSIKGTGSYVDE
ncbi:hypothetical protein K3495_g5593 [Podosphaera aphanis]|nr:hypothetical protein K3495_g5593 [Podosphaera aphanis]